MIKRCILLVAFATSTCNLSMQSHQNITFNFPELKNVAVIEHIYVDSTMLGTQLKNPVNVRHEDNNNWQGLSGHKKGFCKFNCFKNGYRAAYILVKNYINIYHQNTIRKIVTKYAPVNENDTEEYIANVERWSGINAGRRIKPTDSIRLAKIIAAMTRQETGTIVTWQSIKTIASQNKW